MTTALHLKTFLRTHIAPKLVAFDNGPFQLVRTDASEKADETVGAAGWWLVPCALAGLAIWISVLGAIF